MNKSNLQSKELEEHLGIDYKSEKSDLMESRYATSDDPWNNRGRYDKYLEKVVVKIKELVPNAKILELGSGPGYVGESVNSGMQLPIENYYHYDISQSAINVGVRLGLIHEPNGFVVDLNTFERDDIVSEVDVLSAVDVLYYLGGEGNRSYRATLDKLWDNMKVGSYFMVSDSLIRHHYRDYLKKKENCEVVMDYTEYDHIFYMDDNNRRRYLKIRLYKKIA